ncbi:C40 family peptidase [Bacillus alkalicellulosilyticus]|uniref:C40 family peptidase n=1 Tax=Alkalihalobacterium alkalicellulosilyticum TaxID=1912214 RepID=UPI0014823DCA|nr:NlpC/P60 family protein [Bacillus alkalicellulosilyticus]
MGRKHTKEGFDASDFTKYAFEKSSAKINIPRSVKEQFNTGKAVKQKNLKKGDLVFFNANRTGKEPTFVGIYNGNGKFYAATVSKGVSIQGLQSKYWKDRYIGAKRVISK